MNQHFRSAVAALAAASLLAACSPRMDGDEHLSSAAVGKVVYGTIVSSREVTIHSDAAGDGAGVLGGGAVGAAAGASVGKGTGNAAATIGGIIIGAIIGSAIEQSANAHPGHEYIVRLDAAPPAPTANPPITASTTYRLGLSSQTVADDVKGAMQLAPVSTETISVIQTGGTLLPASQRVMVVYSDDRPRVTPL